MAVELGLLCLIIALSAWDIHTDLKAIRQELSELRMITERHIAWREVEHDNS